MASVWAQQTIAALKGSGTFGSFNSGVIWTEIKNPGEGRPIPIDPELLAKRINEQGLPLLLGHDPGKPIGRVLATRVFKARDGRTFVAAVFGYYDGAVQSGFSDIGFDLSNMPAPPRELPTMGADNWVEIAVDPVEVKAEWVDRAANGAPLRVKRRSLSHNAAESAIELIRLTIPYVALVWNPFVTAVATEAGKDIYKSFRSWLNRFIECVSEQRNPVLVIQASLSDCDVSFILRGNKLDNLLAARDGLEVAARQANHLVKTLIRQNASPRALFYEFDNGRKIWVPSYAELHDGRLITDNRMLVVAENIPRGLSLGLGDLEDD
ncbi:MAG: hypothetical protein WBW73_17980 [Rhodoplanes sp.]